MNQVMIQLSWEQYEMRSDPGSLQSHVPGQPRVSLGEPHRSGTPSGRVTSWTGCPQPFCGLRGTGRALAPVSLGVCRGLRHGGKGRKELFYSCPVAGAQVPGCCSAQGMETSSVPRALLGWDRGQQPAARTPLGYSYFLFM